MSKPTEQETAEPAPDEIYEPWQPKVGDHVRIRLGECRQVWGPTSRYGQAGVVGHLPEEDSLTGVVIGVARHTTNGIYSHRFGVRFDDGKTIRVGRSYCDCSGYAAIELIPLDRCNAWRNPNDPPL